MACDDTRERRSRGRVTDGIACRCRADRTRGLLGTARVRLGRPRALARADDDDAGSVDRRLRRHAVDQISARAMFPSYVAVLDIVLVLMIAGGDVKIR